MDASFWHERWQEQEIGFHEADGNALLSEHFDIMKLPAGSRVFIPLCGKTKDIARLRSRGHSVVGVELSTLAITQLFDELNLQPRVERSGSLVRYSADGIDIFVGDFFELTSDQLGPVDAIYDRAALVALPPDMRTRYAAHLYEITDAAPQFLVVFVYDPAEMDGPPFPIPRAEIERLYSDRYSITAIADKTFAGLLKDICAATEHVWLLRKEVP